MKRGDQVDVIAISGEHFRGQRRRSTGLRFIEFNTVSTTSAASGRMHGACLRFLLKSSALLTRLHKRNRYDVIHIHNMPDFLVFAAWYPKLTGAKLILDIHDVVPELFASKFQTNFKAAYVELLKAIERMSAKFVDHVIVSNHLWHKTVIARSVPAARVLCLDQSCRSRNVSSACKNES